MREPGNYPDPNRKNLVMRLLVQGGLGANAAKATNILLTGLDSYDLNKYINENERLWNQAFADETSYFVIRKMLQAGVDRMLETCAKLHDGELCDCALLSTSVMGLKMADSDDSGSVDASLPITPPDELVDELPPAPNLTIVPKLVDKDGNPLG